MSAQCTHLEFIKTDTPHSAGCEECIALGDSWVQLRLCRTCGHVGCCDSSKNKHATQHYQRTQHPIVSAFEPGQTWSWCYVDELMMELV
jgi:uncharacterized UBP type Zn finger protein